MNDLELAKIERRIYSVRGVRVILDADLAVLYGVSTKRLNEQFRRNRKRFPDDFAFQLTVEEASSLRSQNATVSPAPSSMRSQNATASKRNVRYRPNPSTSQPLNFFFRFVPAAKGSG
jgi:ORF6N domain